VAEKWVTFSRLGTADLVRLVGEIDMANAADLGAEISLRTMTARAVVVDLTAVSFLDSAGVRLLDALVGELETRRIPIRLVVGETGPVRTTLRLCAFREDLINTDLGAAATSVGR
jgi:anti-sigma B factor antagonist